MILPVNTIINNDALSALRELPDESIDVCITSPPYWRVRSYLKNDDPNKHLELGVEPTVKEYINNLCNIFDEVKRVLKRSGSLWVNIADCFNGTGGEHNFDNRAAFAKYAAEMQYCQKGKYDPSIPKKSLCGIPERFVIEMTERRNGGWVLRNSIIWHKPSCMPSSAIDRFTIDFEYFFFFTKSPRYYFETQFEPRVTGDWKAMPAIGGQKRAGGDNRTYSGNTPASRPEERFKRCVWTINPVPSKGKHYAAYPKKLVRTPIKACCPKKVCVSCGMPWFPTMQRGKHMQGKRIDYDSGRPDGMIFDGRNRPSNLLDIAFQKICHCDTEETIPGIVMDPFAGTGTTLLEAERQGRNWLGIELNLEYIGLHEKRRKGLFTPGVKHISTDEYEQEMLF